MVIPGCELGGLEEKENVLSSSWKGAVATGKVTGIDGLGRFPPSLYSSSANMQRIHFLHKVSATTVCYNQMLQVDCVAWG